MPFKKGQSGNPNGRSSEAQQRQRMARKLLEHLLPRAAKVFEEMLSEEENRGFAAKEIFDRVCGRAPQGVELSGEDGGPVVLKISDA